MARSCVIALVALSFAGPTCALAPDLAAPQAPAAQAALVGTFGGHTSTSFSCRRISAASFI